jgi:1-acyl-sn-glycerol-3-phosphate acyltransferase
MAWTLEFSAKRRPKAIPQKEAPENAIPARLGVGAFLAAAQAGIPVVPVTIRDTRMILRCNQWFPRRGRISMHVGEPLFPEGNDFAAAVRLRDRCRAVILERSGDPDLARERVELPRD